MGGAPFAIDPARIAIEVVLLLPDRHAVLHFIDDVPAGGESFISMRRADAHPYGQLPDLEGSDPVYTRRAENGKPLTCFLDDAFAFLDCECLESLVLEARNDLALVAIADPAFEGRKTACSGIPE